MHPTQKTSTTRAALLVIAALSMLLSGLFIATASRSDAQSTTACPTGFSLTADTTACFRASTTQSTTVKSCVAGKLTPSGTHCYVNATLIPETPSNPYCPEGYSVDDSLGSVCARFELATQGSATCPSGTRGTPGACYILVAKGSGTQVCAQGTLSGNSCVVTGPAPTTGASTCPTSATVISNNGECYTLIAPPVGQGSCTSPYFAFNTVCKMNNTGTNEATLKAFTCPTAPTAITQNTHTTDGYTKIESCEYRPAGVTQPCPAGTTKDAGSNNCRRPEALTPGTLGCSTGFALSGAQCIRFESSTTAAGQCPTGSTQDSNGDCRKPVANAAGSLTCPTNGVLSGSHCVFMAGFLTNPPVNNYVCEAGTATAVTGTPPIVCILGVASSTTATPLCTQGSLSADGLFCLLPRIDTVPAAPVESLTPSFTG